MRGTLALVVLLLQLAAGTGAAPVPGEGAARVRPFPLTEVRLLDGPFRDAMLRDQAYLLRLDPDRLLHTFRLNAGLPSTATPLGGWEAPDVELRGHSVGHYLSACALMYAATGDERFKARADSRRGRAGEGPGGARPRAASHPATSPPFPSSSSTASRRAPARLGAVLHAAQDHGRPARRVPAVRQRAGARRAAKAWPTGSSSALDRLTDAQRQAMLETEFGGMNEVAGQPLRGHRRPGAPAPRPRVRPRRASSTRSPAARTALDGLHANTQIPKIIGAAREYELTGERALPRHRPTSSGSASRSHRSYVIGGHSDGEHFFPVERLLAGTSAPTTAETCNTYNMLKLTRHLFAWAPSARS